MNPAQTGVFNGDMRFIGSVRDQWRTVRVPYLTFSGNYDMKLYPKKFKSGFFGIGGILNYDNAGDGNYNVTDFNIAGSYSHLLNKNHVLSLGLLLGVATEGVTTNGDLTWDNYWTGDFIDPTKGSGENLEAKPRYTYLETGAGVNYKFQKSKRTNFNIGAGFFHLANPLATFEDDKDSRLPMRITLTTLGTIKIIDPLDIQIHGLVNLQGKYNEYVGGLLARLHINQQRGKETALDLGATTRFSDGTQLSFIAPTIALHYKRLYVGASFDINTNPFVANYNVRNGGPEVHVRYIITKVKKLGDKKVCPIF